MQEPFPTFISLFALFLVLQSFVNNDNHSDYQNRPKYNQQVVLSNLHVISLSSPPPILSTL